MKTERRHELQHNVLADKLGELFEVIEPHSRAIVGVVVGVVVILFVWAFMHAREREAANRGWESFFDALATYDTNKLSKTAEEYSTTKVSQWARLMDADLMLSQGIRQMFTDRADAKDQICRAVSMYTTVITESEERSPLIPRAKYGRARAHESLGELTIAREEYNDIVREGGPFAKAAKERAVDLDQTNSKAFYDWFARFEPPRPAAAPESKPDFLKDSLDRPPDFKLPSLSSPASQAPAESAKGGPESTGPAMPPNEPNKSSSASPIPGFEPSPAPAPAPESTGPSLPDKK